MKILHETFYDSLKVSKSNFFINFFLHVSRRYKVIFLCILEMRFLCFQTISVTTITGTLVVFLTFEGRQLHICIFNILTPKLGLGYKSKTKNLYYANESRFGKRIGQSEWYIFFLFNTNVFTASTYRVSSVVKDSGFDSRIRLIINMLDS